MIYLTILLIILIFVIFTFLHFYFCVHTFVKLAYDTFIIDF